MYKSPLELLKQGTDSAVVAKNWHHHKVPVDVQKSIYELVNLTKKVKGDDELVDELKNDISEMESLLEQFLTKWPAPTITLIVDKISPMESIPKEWYSTIKLQQSRPAIPLTCLTDHKSSAMLFYKDESGGEVFKVTNMWYNQPNMSKKIEYSY